MPRIIAFCFVLMLVSCKQRTDNTNKNTATGPNPIGCMPQTTDLSWYSSGKKAPLFKGLNGLDFPISTKNAEAQTYFNQGLMLSFAFNHAEAARSFYESTKLDSSNAMGWWGFAYVLGPNYNAGMEKDNFLRANEAVLKAKSLYASSTQKEKDLIDALAYRYSNDSSIARPVLDSAYAVAMRNVYQKYPGDATIAALFAEALMDMYPWNLWNKDGSMQPWTKEIMLVLKKGLLLDPDHAGIHHFYIHATEMSKQPGMGIASADKLRNLVPGSGHLAHMPSHTYLRIGRYHDGVIANQKAVAIDSGYVEACHAQGAYPLAYYPHNYHFLAACATMSGESKFAIAGAKATAALAHKSLLRNPAWATLQHYYTIPWYVEVKLGLWDEIKNSAAPEEDLKYPLAVWHYAQGMLMLKNNNIAAARKNLDNIKSIMKDTSIKALTIWNINSVYDLCGIASKTLEGEILSKEKNYSAAILMLKEAITGEDALNYDEPPDWFFSVRHHLGAVLMDAGKYEEAVKIYTEDLDIFPENGWALKGLMDAYEKLGDTKNHAIIKKRFDAAWRYADMGLSSSRIL